MRIDGQQAGGNAGVGEAVDRQVGAADPTSGPAQTRPRTQSRGALEDSVQISEEARQLMGALNPAGPAGVEARQIKPGMVEKAGALLAAGAHNDRAVLEKITERMTGVLMSNGPV